MTAEPSPRPWRLDDSGTIRDANGCVVVSALNPCGHETRRLIVAAVNFYDRTVDKQLVALLDERDRLRDVVKRMADKLEVHLGIFTASGVWSETGCHETCSLIREARAAIGEDASP